MKLQHFSCRRHHLDHRHSAQPAPRTTKKLETLQEIGGAKYKFTTILYARKAISNICYLLMNMNHIHSHKQIWYRTKRVWQALIFVNSKHQNWATDPNILIIYKHRIPAKKMPVSVPVSWIHSQHGQLTLMTFMVIFYDFMVIFYDFMVIFKCSA